jgi:uncharacterized membrane protein
MSLPPIHPALIYLSVAFMLLSFGADLVAKLVGKPSLARVGFWSLFLATIIGGIAIAAGYWDVNRAALSGETVSLIDLHVLAGWALVGLLIVLLIWRWRIRQQARRLVTKPYVIGALAALALTAFETWYGAELVFSHGAGVAAAGQGVEPAAEAQERLARVKNALAPLEGAVGGVAEKSDTERGRQAR